MCMTRYEYVSGRRESREGRVKAGSHSRRLKAVWWDCTTSVKVSLHLGRFVLGGSSSLGLSQYWALVYLDVVLGEALAPEGGEGASLASAPQNCQRRVGTSLAVQSPQRTETPFVLWIGVTVDTCQ